MNKQVDYNKIANGYDQRFYKNPHQGVLNALRMLLSQEYPIKVLEVGCGTSHWLKSLRSIQAVSLFGIDPSYGMLENAQSPQGLNLFQGVAENLPIKSESIHIVFCINAFHHFTNKIAFIQECYRILTDGGKLAIIGMDPRDQRNNWYIYEYFKGTYQRDLERFPSWSLTEKWLLQFNFKDIDLQDVEMIHDPKFGKAVLNDPFLSKNGCSQLTLLSQAEYEEGLHKINLTLKANKLSPNVFENEILLSMMIGVKPKK